MIDNLDPEQISKIRDVAADPHVLQCPGDVHATFCIAMRRHPEYGALSLREDTDRFEVPIAEVVDLMQSIGMVEITEYTTDSCQCPSGRNFRFLIPPAFVVLMMNLKDDVIRLRSELDSILSRISPKG